METVLEKAQKVGDKLVEDGTITEQLKEKFPRPESIEDVYNFLPSEGGKCNSTFPSLLLFFLLLTCFSGGPSPQEIELGKLLSQIEKIDE